MRLWDFGDEIEWEGIGKGTIVRSSYRGLPKIKWWDNTFSAPLLDFSHFISEGRCKILKTTPRIIKQFKIVEFWNSIDKRNVDIEKKR